jgi:iron-sulfur cluster repair protein YtfE (RIC family)
MKIDSPAVQELSRRWREEHNQLFRYIDATREWVKQVAQRGIPKFGEMAQRLLTFREHLVNHFKCEDEIGNRCLALTRGASEAVTATRRQAHHDHVVLLERIDSFVGELRALEPPFDSWNQAISRMERIIDELEFHEEQESDTLFCLCPPEEETQ